MNNLPLDQHLCFAIYSSWSVINRTYKAALAEIDLTYTQYVIMTLLWEKDHQNVSMLSKQLFLGSNTLTPVLKRLEERGLIQRVRDPKDDRVVNVILTQAGRSLADQAEQVPYCIPENTDIPIDELRSLKEKIEELRELLNASLEDDSA